MPHIVFNQKIDLCQLSKAFTSFFQKEPFLIRLETMFVDKDNLTALIPSIVIDKTHQQFLIEISTSKDKTTIRLYPLTDPEKTDGVKLAMSELAKQMMTIYPDLQITKTNLEPYLKMVHVK